MRADSGVTGASTPEVRTVGSAVRGPRDDETTTRLLRSAPVERSCRRGFGRRLRPGNYRRSGQLRGRRSAGSRRGCQPGPQGGRDLSHRARGRVGLQYRQRHRDLYLQRGSSGADDRGQRRRHAHRPSMQRPAGRHDHPLAWTRDAGEHGWQQHLAGRRASRWHLPLRVPPPGRRHLLVPPSHPNQRAGGEGPLRCSHRPRSGAGRRSSCSTARDSPSRGCSRACRTEYAC